ncbi:hypothetical protein [Saccharopolyspora griseoalba]|uniref:Uncharacterized protein n=1 Tax=Saccharopolyspora griseoalba TaxID=1431848 RepID=A0ABW2LTL1_9PSEU
MELELQSVDNRGDIRVYTLFYHICVYTSNLCQNFAMPNKRENENDLAIRTFRVPQRWWDAWGRITKQQGTTRTARIHDLIRADIERWGDDVDLADLEAGEEDRQAGAARQRLGRTPAPKAPAPHTRTGETDPGAVQDEAMRYARTHFPHASQQHRAAFANAVCAAVTGCSGGWGGPSVREHAAARTLSGQRLTFDDAVDLLGDPDGPIFGPLTELHWACWATEYCHDDDPDDRATLTGQ